jgi:archaemetzincin
LKNIDAKIRLVVYLIIEVVTVGRVKRPLLGVLSRELTRAYALPDGHCLVGPSLEMPPAAYNAQRRQYDAGIILERVQHRIAGESKVLALTDTDLYTRLHDYNFIFGLAQLRGRVALVSLRRLDPTFYGKEPNPRLFLERVTKEAVHELGHTLGLGHCADTKCVMSFSNSILDVDTKSAAFCAECKKRVHVR